MAKVILSQQGYVALVTINRPEAMNALNVEVIEELIDAFDMIDVDNTRCVILTGADVRAFVAGADIAAMANMSSEEARAFAELGHELMETIEYFPMPVIAAVNGYALGGGCELAMACDIRIASENAVFGQPEVGLGITPGFGGTQRLPRLIGSMSIAKELLYTGRNVRSDEALRIGLVSAVHPQESLLDEAWKIANRISANAPIAVENAKTSVNATMELGLEEGIELETDLFSECFDSEDQKEGMAAFLEKRKEKNFKNR
ncbi:MAG TPA: enoyl-CoA hydratase-related protein [Anaerolineaceae bacterium]|jgi:enoyl-CoA hydratase|nr:enoyl-CoA hydratase-related protein [Anaerolineaceae bacterium]